MENLDPPLLRYAEENGYWYADLSPIFVQFNSKDAAYGLDLSQWPASFVDFVAKRLARQTCKRITGKDDLLQGPHGLIKQEIEARRVAAANCAMNEAVGFAPQSKWIRSRMSSFAAGDTPPGGSLLG